MLCPIFPITNFQLPISINVAYVQRVQQHLNLRLCGDVSYISEGTYLGLDLRSDIPILSIVDNAPWVPIEKSGEKFKVYGYRGNQDLPDILERGTYVASYDIPTRGTIILACHYDLGRKNHGNLSLLPTFMMRESVWKVRDVALQHCPEDGDPNRHCLILTTSG